MGLFDRIFGKDSRAPTAGRPSTFGAAGADEQAIARYRYMLRTAPPEAIEQTHAEAFAQLTPDQRRKVLDELSRELPEAERATVLRAGETPAALARAATRAEMRQPGTIERTFGRVGAGPGLGGMMAGTFLSTMAGVVLGTALAQSFLGDQAAGLDASGEAGGPPADAHDPSAEGFADAGDTGGFDIGDGGIDI
jgi:hypothetical protein